MGDQIVYSDLFAKIILLAHLRAAGPLTIEEIGIRTIGLEYDGYLENIFIFGALNYLIDNNMVMRSTKIVDGLETYYYSVTQKGVEYHRALSKKFANLIDIINDAYTQI